MELVRKDFYSSKGNFAFVLRFEDINKISLRLEYSAKNLIPDIMEIEKIDISSIDDLILMLQDVKQKIEEEMVD